MFVHLENTLKCKAKLVIYARQVKYFDNFCLKQIYFTKRLLFNINLGTYSLGGGVRYEQLTQMPAGFSVENFADQTDQLLFDQNDQSIDCPSGYFLNKKILVILFF